MPNWSTILAELEAHVTTFALTEHAKRGFEACFANEGGTIDGWTAAELRPEFHSHRLAFAHRSQPPYLDTCLTLHASDGREVGRYRLITDFDGTVVDDYLELHGHKGASIQKPQLG